MGVYSGSSLPNSTIPAVAYYEADKQAGYDYFPFGMMSRTTGNAGAYRFGFNGKENDNEVKGFANQQDYGMRIYDPRLGRFLSVDPLTQEYPWNSPYSYAENDVIRSIDLDGAEKAVRTNYFYVSNGQTQIKVTDDVWKSDADIQIHPLGKPQTDKEIAAHNEITYRKTPLPGNGTFVYFEFAPEIGKANYARYTYTDAGGNQQVRYFSQADMQYRFEEIELAKKEVDKNYNLVAALANLAAAGWMVKAEMKAVSGEFKTEIKTPSMATQNVKCFVAGTKVLTHLGLINIEDIKVGDSVWAFNDANGEVAVQKVEALSRRLTGQLVKLKIGQEVIWTTPEHPFWVNNMWASAKDINVGDSVMVFSKLKQIISGKVILDSVANVYNFTVSQFHTYFVSRLGVLVHNDCFHKVPYKGNQVAVYRGGSTFNLETKHYKINPETGLVKTTHGLSLDIDPNTIRGFGGAYRIESIPDGLKIQQRGQRLEHYEIMPAHEMSVETFQSLLKQVKTKLIE